MRIIGKIDKGTGQIRVVLHEWESQAYVDIRLWYEKDGEYHPSTKGLRFHCELLPQLIEAFQQAEAMIERGEDVGDSREAGESQG